MMRVAVVGATGLVGREIWALVEKSPWPNVEIIAYTTARSEGKLLSFRGKEVVCRELRENTLEAVDLVLASAGAQTSRDWTPRFVERGAVVVDNSSAFRMDPSAPLVVPEVNGADLDSPCSVVANPNCSTIQMVAALKPLHDSWELRSVRVATYQAVSGAGSRAMAETLQGIRDHLAQRSPSHSVFPHPIPFNALPHVGIMGEWESDEEVKMREESRRILRAPHLQVSATCVRIPVLRGHSEAVWASFEREPDPVAARRLMEEAGLWVLDDPAQAQYPTAAACAGDHHVWVGRVRADHADPRGLCLWVVSDNLLKGAATNAVQIAERLVANRFSASLES